MLLAARAGGVGAERDRDYAGGDRDSGARARAAGDQPGRYGIAWDAVGRARAGQPGGELIEIGLADDDRAGAPQARDAGRVRRRRIGEGRAGGGGRQTLDVDIVLDRDRHAVKRAMRSALGGDGLGLGDGVGFLAQGDEDRRIAVGADAGIARRHGLGRCRRAAAVGVEDCRDGQVDIGCHGAPTLETVVTANPFAWDPSEQAMCQPAGRKLPNTTVCRLLHTTPTRCLVIRPRARTHFGGEPGFHFSKWHFNSIE